MSRLAAPPPEAAETISVCICTYQRQAMLADLLRDLARQTLQPCEVVVVDNDASGSAAATIEALRPELPWRLVYGLQPVKNISLTRNATVALASGRWLAFLDDDERVEAEWLARLREAARTHQADGVLGRVVYVLPPEAPAWMRRGDFHTRRKRHASGTVLPLNAMGIGNAFLDGNRVRAEPGPFNERFGLTGGEDSDFMARLARNGAKIVWSDEAVASEIVTADRLRLRWLLLRSLRGGQDFVHHSLAGRFGPMPLASKLKLFGESAAKGFVATLLIAPATLAGRHRGAHWLLKAASNLGKVSAFLDMHYREYQ